jgi:hypothetical protein
MKIQRKGVSDGRVEYQWRVDREQGFKASKLIYDHDGVLIAIDYEVDRLRGTAVQPAAVSVPRTDPPRIDQ